MSHRPYHRSINIVLELILILLVWYLNVVSINGAIYLIWIFFWNSIIKSLKFYIFWILRVINGQRFDVERFFRLTFFGMRTTWELCVGLIDFYCSFIIQYKQHTRDRIWIGREK